MSRGFGQGRYRFTQAQLDRLRRLYETHGTLSAVSAITRVNPTTLRKYERAGWVVIPDPRLLPPPTDLALNAAHMSKAELMEHYGCSCQTLYRWLREIGIESLGRGRFRRVYERLPVPSRDELVDVLSRMEVREAAAHFGVCTLTLRRWRICRGLPIEKRRRRANNDNRVGWVESYVRSDAYRRAA